MDELLPAVRAGGGREAVKVGDRSLTYGQLATKAATLPIPDEKTVRLKKEGEFRVMGSRVGGVDNPARDSKICLLNLSADEVRALVSFLKSL